MAILIKKHSDEGGFTKINNQVIQDNRLNNSSKGVFSIIMSMKDGWNVNIEILKKYTADGRKSIGNSLRMLEETGYIKRKMIYENGRISNWVYEINDFLSDDENTW